MVIAFFPLKIDHLISKIKCLFPENVLCFLRENKCSKYWTLHGATFSANVIKREERTIGTNDCTPVLPPSWIQTVNDAE